MENHDPGFEQKGLMSDARRWWLNSGLWFLIFAVLGIAAMAEATASEVAMSLAAATTISFWTLLGYGIGAHHYNAYGKRLGLIAALVAVMAATLGILPFVYDMELTLAGATVDLMGLLAAVGFASFLFFFMVVMNQYG